MVVMADPTCLTPGGALADQDALRPDFLDVSAALARNVRERPGQAAFREVDAAGELLAEISWRDLGEQVQSSAAQLRKLHRLGETVLLPQQGSLAFVVALLACLEAGVVAVPLAQPRHRRHAETLAAIAADCGARTVISNVEGFDAFAPTGLSRIDLDILSPRQIESHYHQAARHPPEALAFLQYTSGSTNDPKGVMVLRSNLSANAAAIIAALQVDTQSRFVTWLPLFHDMGLVTGIFVPVLSGATSTLMPSSSFSRAPATWLRLIERYRATHAGGPNFAFDLCARRINAEEAAGFDLASWRSAYLGAEPILNGSLRAFAERFGAAGFDPAAFQPCYGLAETTLLATAGSADCAPQTVAFSSEALTEGIVRRAVPGEPSRTLVGCGSPATGSTVAIVSPETGAVCENGRMGEICLYGPSVAAGYWRRPEETARTFRFSIGDRHYLRTGDLGFVFEGELYVTGRLKECLIVRGQTFQPHDIETAALHAHPDLEPGQAAAFPIAMPAGSDPHGERRESVAVACGLKRTALRHADHATIFGAIRRAVVRATQLDPDAIMLVGPTALPRTTSGKLKRGECRRLLDQGLFETIAIWERPEAKPMSKLGSTASAAEIADHIVAWLGVQLQLPRESIPLDAPFEEIGLDSMGSVELALSLELALGRPLDQTVIWNAATVMALARAVAPPDPSAKVGQKPAPAPPVRRLRNDRVNALLDRLRATITEDENGQPN